VARAPILWGMGRKTNWAVRAAFALMAAGALMLPESEGRAQSAPARPWLGVVLDGDGPGACARVGHVTRGSPADRAGMREGDCIIRVEAARITGGSEVVRAVSMHGIGDAVDIAFIRAGSEQRARVGLAPFPGQDEMLRMDLVGAFAPAWKDLQPVRGTFPTSLGPLRGRVIVLDFWATWCGPCRVFVPKLAALQTRYGAQGLNVIGVSTEDAKDVALFAENATMPYAVAVDKRGQTTRSYGVFSLPTIVVIDKRGVVRDVAVGYDSTEDSWLDATVRSLLTEPGPEN